MTLIGIPYKDHGRTADGVDCYGLVYYAYQQLGRTLPSFSSAYRDPLAKDRAVIEALIDENKHIFTEVHIEDAEKYDVLLFRVMGAPSHVALFDTPGHMFNADVNAGVVREKYTTPRWKSRLVGAYRLV